MNNNRQIRAARNFETEIKELIGFYKINVNYLDSLIDVKIWKEPSINETSTEIDNKLKFDTYSKEIKVRGFRANLPNIARELIFIRIISALEVFLIDGVKDVFKETIIPFQDIKTITELSNAELLSYSTISNLKNRILHKETRPLSSGGYKDIIKYYNKRFKIDITNIHPGKSKIEYYHELRHLLVHRLGKADKKFKNKYGYNKNNIVISEELLLKMINDVYSYVEKINVEICDLIDEHTKPKKYKSFEGQRYLIQFASEIKNKIKFLQPDYHFWANDEIYVFKDLPSRVTNVEGNINIEIWGEHSIIRGYVKNIKAKLKTSKYFDRVKIELIRHPVEIDETIILAVSKKLPKQPWSTGIHKVIANEFGISNSLASKIISILIERGAFKRQKNGKFK